MNKEEDFWKSHHTDDDMKKHIVWGAVKEEDFNRLTPIESERVIKALSLGEGSNKLVLDFGCGNGRLARFIAANTNHRVLGTDVDSHRIERAKQYVLEPFNIITGINELSKKVEYGWVPQFCVMSNSYTLPITAEGNNKIDFIYSHIVLQHIHKFKVYLLLKEFYRVLRKGGLAFIQLPNFEECLKSQWGEYCDNYVLFEHTLTATMHMWMDREIRLILEKIGFEVVKVEREATDYYITFKKPE